MLRITGPNFVVGYEYNHLNIITYGPPLLHYMIGWKVARAIAYAKKKNWTVEIINV